jgi:hypothetical protein
VDTPNVPAPTPRRRGAWDVKRLHLLLRRRRRLFPMRVDLRCALTWPGPWLQPHYRAFLAATARSSPVPPGTLPLAVMAAWGSPSRRRGAVIARLDRSAVRRRQVLPFPTGACDELTPPVHRAAPGGRQAAPRLPAHRVRRCPGAHALPRFRCHRSCIPVRRQWFARARLLVAYLTRCARAFFPQRPPPRLLTAAACGGLVSPPARQDRRAFLHRRWSIHRCRGVLSSPQLASGHTA